MLKIIGISKQARQAGNQADRLVEALLTTQEVFGEALPNHPLFRQAVTESLDRLLRYGVRTSLASHIFRALD